jgi:acetyl esterase/lipase
VDEALADPDLQVWLTKLRKQQPSISVPDLALLRAPPVLSVDFRRAPELPAPAAVDDLFNVARWAAAAPDELGPVLPSPTLAGDSAGGTIAVLAAARWPPCRCL